MKLLVLFALVCTVFAVEETDQKVQKKRSLYDGYPGLYGSTGLGLPSISSHTHTHSSAIIVKDRPVAVPVPSYTVKSTPYIPTSSLGYDSYGLGYPSLYSASSLTYPTKNILKFGSSYPSTFSSYPLSSYSAPSYSKFSPSIPSYDYGYNYPLTKSLPSFGRTSFYPKISTYPTIYKKSYYSSPIISKWWWRCSYFPHFFFI